MFGNAMFENSVKESLNEEALNVKSIITPAIRKLDKVFKKNKKGLAGQFKVIGQIGVGVIVGAW